MSVSHHQFRAARSFLGLDQKDVARVIDISNNALSEIERGIKKPKTDTLERLIVFFESAGVEFTQEGGINPRQKLVQQLKGAAGFRILMNMVYDFASGEGGTITLLNGSPKQFQVWLGEDWYAFHAERMKAVKDKIGFRIIVEEGERTFIASDFAQYRWLPKAQFNDRAVYVFGNHSAFFNFSEEDLRIVVITQRCIAETQQMAFDAIWDKAMVPD